MTVSKDIIREGLALESIYKSKRYTCQIISQNGKLWYTLPDGNMYKSISGAAGAITGIPTTNGWMFWDMPGDERTATERPVKIKQVSEHQARKSGTTVVGRGHKRTNTKKPKDWSIIEDEYLAGADQVLAMTMNTNANNEPDEEYNEKDFRVICTVCNKEFKTNIEASEHFSLKH